MRVCVCVLVCCIHVVSLRVRAFLRAHVCAGEHAGWCRLEFVQILLKDVAADTSLILFESLRPLIMNSFCDFDVWSTR